MILRRCGAALALVFLPAICVAAPAPASSANQISTNAFRLDRAPQQGGMALGTAPPGTRRLTKDGADVAFAPDGRFVIAFGRDHATIATLSATMVNGRSITDRIHVAPRAWRIESLPTLPHHRQPDAEFEARRPAELAQIKAAREIISDSQGWRQDFIWPARGRISGVFGSQRIYAGQPGAPHSGVDVAGPTGTPVVAPADGLVILATATPFTLEGNLLMIDHGLGLNSAFLHLSRIDVKPGDDVRQGQAIGAIGRTGRVTGPHLHWGMKWHEERIDPATVVRP